MIKKNMSFDEFKEFNYIFYDQYLFRSLLSIYQEENIKYRILAINLFKDREIAPIVIDIKSMSSRLLEDYYENIFLVEQTEYINKFDQMPLVQNLIKSDLGIDDLAVDLTSLMLFKDKVVFRYYDPRVMLQLYFLNQYENVDKDLSLWKKRFLKVFESWTFGLMDNWFEIKSNVSGPLIVIRFGLQDFEKTKINFKQRINSSLFNDSEIELFSSEYLSFEVGNGK